MIAPPREIIRQLSAVHLVTRTGIGRLARRSLVAAVLTAIQAVIHCRFLRFPALCEHKRKREADITCLLLFFW